MNLVFVPQTFQRCGLLSEREVYVNFANAQEANTTETEVARTAKIKCKDFRKMPMAPELVARRGQCRTAGRARPPMLGWGALRSI